MRPPPETHQETRTTRAVDRSREERQSKKSRSRREHTDRRGRSASEHDASLSDVLLLRDTGRHLMRRTSAIEERHPHPPLGPVRWRWPSSPGPTTNDLRQEFRITPLAARIATSRGLSATDVEALEQPPQLREATRRTGMPRQVGAIAAGLRARARLGPIGLLADYDVDGGCASAIIRDALLHTGVDVRTVVPRRDTEGFGPNRRCIAELARTGCRTVLTLDCGSTATPLLDRLESETDVRPFVMDHHSAEGGGAHWEARMLNPHADPLGAPWRGLCSAGLAWMLARALVRDSTLGQQERNALGRRWTVLAGIATVCDVMPTGPDQALNRALVNASTRMAHEGGAGIEALRSVGRIGDRAARPDDWGWVVGPRLNAGSRMGKSSLAARLLCAQGEQAQRIAEHLNDLNTQRRKAGREAEDRVRARTRALAPPVLVVADAETSPGIAGIVAGRMVEWWGWPAIVIGPSPGGGWHGSGRSAMGWNMGEALRELSARALGVEGGGHPQACGLRIERGRVEAVKAALDAHFERSVGRAASPVRTIDAVLHAGDCTAPALEATMETLGRWTPWGPDWPEPRLGIKGARIAATWPLGTKGIRLDLRIEGQPIEAVWWGAPPRIATTGVIDAEVCLDRDTRRGREHMPPRLKVIRAQEA